MLGAILRRVLVVNRAVRHVLVVLFLVKRAGGHLQAFAKARAGERPGACKKGSREASMQDETFNFLVFRKIRRLADLVTTTADK